jgi:glutamyl-tRNA synthetase
LFPDEDPCRSLPFEEAKRRLRGREPCHPHESAPGRDDNLQRPDHRNITVENKTLDDRYLSKATICQNTSPISSRSPDGHYPVVRGSEYLASAPKYNIMYTPGVGETPLFPYRR